MYEVVVCTNREELINALNYSGRVFHTVRSLWDFDSYETRCRPVQEIFTAATEAALEERTQAMTEIALFDYFERVWADEDVWEEFETDDGFSGYCSTKFINEVIDLIMDFAGKEGYCLDIGENNKIGLIDRTHPENGFVAGNLAEVVQMIREWNYTFMNAGRENEESKNFFLRNAITIEKLEEKVGSRCGY